MNAPSKQTRLIAFPPVALALLLLCGLFVVSWGKGTAPWYVGVIALMIGGQVIEKVSQVRRYKEWRAAWDAMGAAAPAPKKLSNVLVVSILATAILVVSNWDWIKENAQGLVVLAVLIGVPVLVVTLIWRLWRKRKTQQATGPVAWLITPASSSPSRTDAMRALPEYSASVLSKAP